MHPALVLAGPLARLITTIVMIGSLVGLVLIGAYSLGFAPHEVLWDFFVDMIEAAIDETTPW